MPAVADQFKGLPMGDLIGGPLQAACDAQVKMARATSDFIQVVGFTQEKEIGDDGKETEKNEIRSVKFHFDRPVQGFEGGTSNKLATERVELEVPLLAIVNVPALSIKTVDVIFDMEVKSSESEKSSEDMNAELDLEASVGYGPFSAKVHVHGSVSKHKEHTRHSDQSAKYHVEVHARDDGMPEGLARVMDILQSSVAPKSITGDPANKKITDKQADDEHEDEPDN